jgi:hypothetical protein
MRCLDVFIRRLDVFIRSSSREDVARMPRRTRATRRVRGAVPAGIPGASDPVDGILYLGAGLYLPIG